ATSIQETPTSTNLGMVEVLEYSDGRVTFGILPAPEQYSITTVTTEAIPVIHKPPPPVRPPRNPLRTRRAISLESTSSTSTNENANNVGTSVIYAQNVALPTLLEKMQQNIQRNKELNRQKQRGSNET